MKRMKWIFSWSFNSKLQDLWFWCYQLSRTHSSENLESMNHKMNEKMMIFRIWNLELCMLAKRSRSQGLVPSSSFPLPPTFFVYLLMLRRRISSFFESFMTWCSYLSLSINMNEFLTSSVIQSTSIWFIFISKSQTSRIS